MSKLLNLILGISWGSQTHGFVYLCSSGVGVGPFEQYFDCSRIGQDFQHSVSYATSWLNLVVVFVLAKGHLALVASLIFDQESLLLVLSCHIQQLILEKAYLDKGPD